MGQWRIYEHEDALMCPECGADVRVKTSLSQEEVEDCWYQDGAEVQCTECEMVGFVSCDEETPPTINEIVDFNDRAIRS